MQPAERAALLLAAQRRAREMSDSVAPIGEILAHLCRAAEALSRNTTVASILVLDADKRLRNGASPGLPPDYLAAIDGLRPDADLGTCAAAAATGEVVTTPSFLADRRWAELKHLPLALGFRGAWSQPIKGKDGDILGTFGTYYREQRSPDGEEREAIAILARSAALAIERARDAGGVFRNAVPVPQPRP